MSRKSRCTHWGRVQQRVGTRTDLETDGQVGVALYKSSNSATSVTSASSQCRTGRPRGLPAKPGTSQGHKHSWGQSLALTRPKHLKQNS